MSAELILLLFGFLPALLGVTGLGGETEAETNVTDPIEETPLVGTEGADMLMGTGGIPYKACWGMIRLRVRRAMTRFWAALAQTV